jgi:hypothetical protein
MENNLTIKSFRGGISPEGDKGPRGSFKFGRGLNIHSNRDSLKCNQALKKDTGSVVTDLVLDMVRASDGRIYAFGDTGKIYRKASGTWTLVHTDSDGKITGAEEFETENGSQIYYATTEKLKKISLDDAAGTWAGNVTTEGEFNHGSADTHHTMRVAVGVLCISDGPHLAIVDYDEAFNPVALNLPPKLWSQVLLDRSNETTDRIIMGTSGRGITEGWFVTWDRQADSWLAKKSSQGGFVNQMAFLEGGVIAQVGNQGHLKFWNFADAYPLNQIPNVTKGNPNAVTELNTMPYLGLNGAKGGVYSIGRINKNDPIAINLEYIPSHGKYTGEIGALCADGDNLLVSWKDGSTYGIDITDTENKAVAVYESLEMDMGRPQTEKLCRHIKIVTRPLPEGASIVAKYKMSRDDDWVLASMSDDSDLFNKTGESKAVFNIEGQGEIYETQLTLNPAGNNSPEVLSINTYFDFDNVI